MKPKMRRKLSGAFLAQETADGMWRLRRAEAPEIDVYLRGVQIGAAEALRSPISEAVVEWRRDAVTLTFSSGDRPRSVEAQSVVIHEPLPRLYETLPLAGFDDGARRFWRRVFRLVRLPGGRFLLRILARRARSAR